MRVGYRFVGTTYALICKRLVVVAGLLILPIAAKIGRSNSAKDTPTESPRQSSVTESSTPGPDPRTAKLRKYFFSQHCPVLGLAEDFVHAADDNHLDWRLLPGISIIESGGGRAFRNNNIFGWNNGNDAFPTIRAGLNTVAFKLGKSALYRNRDVKGKLRLYNPDESYAGKVLSVMNRISPVADLTRGNRLVRAQNQYVYLAN